MQRAHGYGHDGPTANPETCASWLRMRNRDGRYKLMFEEWVTEGDFIISPR
mgnify:CR=1 FL=1